MRSSDEMFEKFLKWKENNTFLKVTVSPVDRNSRRVIHRTVSVVSVVEPQIGLMAERRPPDILLLDLGDAKFVLGVDGKSLDVTLEDGERWLFEEIPPC